MDYIDGLIDDSVLSYNIRTFTGILLLLLLKPWSWYEPFKLKNLPISILVGFFVFNLDYI